MPTRIIIADDHQLFRQGLIQLFDGISNMEVVEQASNGMDAKNIIESLIPDVAILDVGMPILSGIEVAEKLSEVHCPTAIVLLTMHKGAALLKRVQKLPKVGYVLKDNAFEELLLAVQYAIEKRVFISPAVSQLDRQRDRVLLTNRETEILSLIADGLSSKQISKQLFISLKTVETHRSNLMRKMDVSNSPELIRKATANGWL